MKQNALLELLATRESWTSVELAQELGVLPEAARWRLNRLTDRGWVEQHAVESTKGRPRKAWRLRITIEEVQAVSCPTCHSTHTVCFQPRGSAPCSHFHVGRVARALLAREEP